MQLSSLSYLTSWFTIQVSQLANNIPHCSSPLYSIFDQGLARYSIMFLTSKSEIFELSRSIGPCELLRRMMSATQTIDRPSQQQSELLNTLDQVSLKAVHYDGWAAPLSDISQLTAGSTAKQQRAWADSRQQAAGDRRQETADRDFRINVYGKRTVYELRSTTWNMHMHSLEAKRTDWNYRKILAVFSGV
jgi:hypothetical protein